MESIFNNTFNKYTSDKDKFESLYVFVIYDQSKEIVDERLNKISKIIDSIPDAKKKNFLKSRITNFKKYFDSYKNDIVNGIFLVSDDVKYINLEKYYIDTLKEFKINFSYQYGKTYDIDWLKKFLLDRDYTLVLKIKNNDVSISKVTSTKQLGVYSDTIKSLVINDIISSKIDKDTKFLIHGSSASLKNFEINNKNCIGCYNKELTLEQQIDMIEEAKYKHNIKELEVWLEKLLDPKDGHKLVFGNDIEENAENELIQTIYCTPEKSSRFIKFTNCEIKLVKSFKSGDFVNTFEKNYDGVLGIKYY